jgi:hypothetical protein|tara:strand:+ start:396 stop:698 length:303 start_codon:yes stop_codon:yes gene_type:complete
MPIIISGSEGSTTISGSNTTISGSGGQTNYGGTSISGSEGTTLSGSQFPLADTGSCNLSTLGAMTVQTDGNCQRFYLCMSGSTGPEWVFVTGSTGCTGSV